MREFTCQKCGNHTFEQGKFQATGGWFSKIHDVQNKKFITISCKKCGYTEIYKGRTSLGMNLWDFFTK